MSVPDWITLSSTSGSGDGSISVTAAENTTRGVSRSATFRIKNERGMIRSVNVYQAGAAEVLTIDPACVSLDLPATAGSFTISGTSNAQTLRVRVSGDSALTPLSYTANGVPFTSGEVITGDPGLNTVYSYSLVFSYSANDTNNDRVITVYIATPSDEVVTCITTQAHSGNIDYDTGGVPRFASNITQEVPSVACVFQMYVMDTDSVGWSIVVSGNVASLPSSGNVAQVAIVDNTSSSEQLLHIYLVPSGASDISQGVYDEILLRQQAYSDTRMIIGDNMIVSQYIELESAASGMYEDAVLTAFYNDEPCAGLEVSDAVSGNSGTGWIMVNYQDRFTDNTGKAHPIIYYTTNTTGSARAATVTFSVTKNGSTGSASITFVQPKE